MPHQGYISAGKSGRWLIASQRIGASHRTKGMPCQDAMAAVTAFKDVGPDGYIVAIADGHGDSPHDRSDVGAREAVRAAVFALRRLWRRGRGSQGDFYRQFRDEFPRIVVREWQRRVIEHDRNLEGRDLAEDGKARRRVLRRYGTTLIVALVTKHYYVIGRIGDGDAIHIQKGEPEEVFDIDPDLIGTSTHSLCNNEPYRHWETNIIYPSLGDILLLSTDGLSDSYPDLDRYKDFVRQLHQRIGQFGPPAVAANLPTWLDALSHEASGDDITLAAVCANVADFEPLPMKPFPFIGRRLADFVRRIWKYFTPQRHKRVGTGRAVMHLKDADTLVSKLGDRYTVAERLGTGAQGTVYHVRRDTGDDFALKWYNVEKSTHSQLAVLNRLVQAGPPRGEAGHRFVWPRDIVTHFDKEKQKTFFGYIMPLIDKQIYRDLNDIYLGKVKQPTFEVLCGITYQIANSYRLLHLTGRCYRDISHGNIMIDTATGNVLICDNDNVGNDDDDDAQVVGTWQYMAPEIVLGGRPSIGSDLHSLAVVLFKLWMWHHPMHGIRESEIRVLDDVAYTELYGQKAAFIFDPVNTTNAVSDTEDYESVRQRWALCPEPLRTLFVAAFTRGLHDKAMRVTEGQWERAALAARDCIASCSHCRAENSLLPVKRGSCWNCDRELPKVSWLCIEGPSGEHSVPLQRGFVLRKRHLTGNVQDTEALGALVQNPADLAIWGLRNEGLHAWRLKTGNDEDIEVLPQRAVPISIGSIIMFEPFKQKGARGLISIPELQ